MAEVKTKEVTTTVTQVVLTPEEFVMVLDGLQSIHWHTLPEKYQKLYYSLSDIGLSHSDIDDDGASVRLGEDAESWLRNEG